MIWQFKINGVEIEEPIGWDAVVLNVTRSTEYWGLENVYSDNISFWDTGAQIIKTAYEADGIDAELEFEANYDCGSGYVNYISGILNCFFYQIENNVVTVKIEPSGFHRDIKNNIDTPVNLLATTSIDGSDLSDFAPFELGMHSKGIVRTASADLNTFLADYTETGVNDEGNNFFYFPMDTISDEFDELNPVSTMFQFNVTLPAVVEPIFTAPVAGDYEFTYNFKGNIYETASGARSFDFNMGYSVGAPPMSAYTIIGGTAHYSSAAPIITVPFDQSGTITVTMAAGQQIAFFTRMFNSTPPRSADVRQVLDQASVSIKNVSIYPPTTAKAWLIHEVFAILTESMTGVKDSFRSDFFGQENSFPHQYAANGCGAWTAITNGKAIRNMLTKEGIQYDVVTDFKQFFADVDAIFNIGMRVQKEGGIEYLRVEPKEYFFNASQVLTIYNVSDLKKTPATDYIFNTYDNGYEKWNLNITGSNALDEINSQHSYTLPVKKSNTGFVKRSKLIASGYVIEQTRRLQFSTLPTNDFETDDDLFIICTNREEITSDKYTDPAVSTTYAAGTVSERDENFTGITNLLSPDTPYNLRVSPARIAANWYKFVSASLFKNPTASIKFVSGQGNYLEGDTMINDCVVIDTVLQNQNILKSEINGIQSNNIFNPEYLEFTYTLSFDQFSTVLQNMEKAIGVSCSNSGQYIGFIVSLKLGVNSDGALGEFKLLSGSCLPGDFNNDFNIDFYTGNC